MNIHVLTAKQLFIDGFNLMYQIPELEKRLEKGFLRDAIEDLIQRLVVYARKSAKRITLIIDGKKAPYHEAGKEVFEQVQVYYSHEKSADELIYQFIAEHKNPKQILLISSDQALQKVVSSFGSRILSSQSFVNFIDNKELSIATQSEKPQPSKRDTDYWQKIFKQNA